uniref:TPR_REGION domain-containing protein n=1 Tax=Caenorhabditis tropicalis TaxID=1561998 RepID=A0A1I7TW51_9PELO
MDDFDENPTDSEDRKKWGHKDVEHWRAVSNVHYYTREGYYGTAMLVCDGRLATIRDVPLAILKGVCLTLLGRIPEAIRQLGVFSSDNEYALGALHALKWAHSNNKSIMEIESEISSRARNEKTPFTSYASASEVLYFAGEYQKAKQMLDVARKRATEKHAKHYCLLGWIDLALGKKQKSTQELFEKAGGQEYPDGNIGRCKILEGHHSATEMRVAANELAISTIHFLPGHIEKAKASIMLKDWNGVMDCIVNADQPDGSNPYIEVLRTVYSICYAGEMARLGRTLQLLLKSLDENEASNHGLYAKIAKLIVSISGKNERTMRHARDFLARALKISRKPDYVALSMRIAFAMGDAKEVATLSQELIAMDCEDSYALMSRIISMLMVSRVSDAKAQFDILPSAHPKLLEAPLYYLIASVLAKQSKDKSFENFRQHIENLIEMLRNQLQSFPFGLDYLSLFSSDLLYSAVEQCFDFYPLVPMKAPDECMKLTSKTLQMIHDTTPGLAHCSLQLARNSYLCSNTNAAEKWIEKTLEKDDSLADAHILRAQLILDRGGKITDADDALVTGLNFNFKLRETSLYHLIKSKTFKKRNENDEAIKTLKMALQIPKKEVSNNLFVPKESADTHKISVQLELIDTLQQTKRIQEAEDTMSDALAEWAGQPEQDQLVIAQSQLYLTKGHVEKALAILKKIQPGQSNFHLSRIKMAEIYLEEKKDKRMFASCYRELLKVEPTPGSYSLLGDAFMKVQEPEDAINFYEQALKMQSKDVQLAEKIGEAYVMAHLYSKAVNFYESSMNIYKDKNMRLKLANLLLKLRNFEKCEKVLKAPLDRDPDPVGTENIQTHIQFLLLLAECHEMTDNVSEALKDFEKAKSLHNRIQDKTMTATLKKEGARICNLQAELLFRRHEYSQAVDICKQALQYYETDLKANLLLSKIFKEENKWTLVLQPCQTVIQVDPHNDEANSILADFYYIKSEANHATTSYTTLLNTNPQHWHALSRIVELSCRSGDSLTAERYLERAKEVNPRCVTESGYNVCRGRFEWYTGDQNEALRYYSRTKDSAPPWREKALYYMIDICLNPDNEIIITEDSVENPETTVIEEAHEQQRQASHYLESLSKHAVTDRFLIAKNFIKMHTTDKGSIQSAVEEFSRMAFNADRTQVISVGALYGVAKGHILLKQVPKAKTVLKMVIGRSWNFDDSDYLERCWLLLADIYIQQNKNDQAINFLELVFKNNCNCLKAFELYGLMKEKEQKYVEAYKMYEKAFMATKERNPQFGYKLAFTYLKARRLFACIETCQKVLDLNPQYPKIKKEIMDKAKAQIRT